MSSKARRPYLMGKKSVTQFYQAPVRYLKEIVSKESEFEKPYVDEEYRKMHFDFPWPDWPPFPEIPPWPPWSPPEGPVPGLPGCAIVCYEPSDCDDPIWCHPGIWCGQDIGCTLCTWMVEGAITGYTPHLSGVGSWGIDIWLDANLVEEDGKALVTACMTDPCGNVCCQDLEVTCKVCPPDIVVSWDSVNSAETIARNSSVSVFVLDGLGPYSWSVAGTGFSMAHATTEGKSNTLIADATACGSATITVTDFCDDTTTGYVRGTAASYWAVKSTGSCVLVGAATWYAVTRNFEYVEGNKKQRERISYHGGGWPYTCGVDDFCDNHCVDGYHCLGAPFIDTPSGWDVTPNCRDGGGDQIECYCGHNNLDYSEWECS